MALEKILTAAELPAGSKKAVKVGETEILLVHTEQGGLHAVEAKCPHAGAPLEGGAVCNGRLICPWHMGSFELETGALVEPPPLRSLRHYAVERQGDAILVDPEPLNTPSLANYDDNAPAKPVGAERQIVTIGSGAAAMAAVCTLRQSGFAGTITMIDPEASEPLDRTALSKMALAGKKPLEELPLWTPDEKAQLKIERLQAAVAKLDGEQGSLETADGRTIRFDAALLATGGTPRRLGIAGEQRPMVHTLRHAQDVEAIATQLGETAKGKRAVLVGDSFIAFEAASALRGRGLEVTVVCRSAKPFAQKFGDAQAEALTALHEANGVVLKRKAETKEIAEDAVLLESGERLPADLVIVAVGVEPMTDFEHGLQLEEDGGVPVREDLRAAAKLWVAGDIAEVNGTRIEHWRLAEQHGRTAAMAMLRQPGAQAQRGYEVVDDVPFFWTAHFGKRFGYIGHAEKWDRVELEGSLEEQKFLAYYLKGAAVKAVLGCGRDAAMAMLSERMRKTLTLEQAQQAARQAA